MKKLFSFVCALVCAMSLSAAKTIYLNTGGSDLWEQSGAVFVEGVSAKDMTAVDGAFGYYQVSVDDSQTTVKFLRMKGDKSAQWNATAELTIPTDGNDCYTITGWGEKEGNWSKYTTPGPVDPSSIVYSIKHPWKDGKDGSWSYKDLTANGDGTYSIRECYGGKGCNWKSTVSGEQYIESPTLVGNPAVGDSAIFTLTSTEGKGAITITKIASTGGEGGNTPDPEPTYNYYLVGTAAENGWNAGKAMPMANDQIVRSLAAGVYEFQILTALNIWEGALGYNDVNAECSSEGYQKNGNNVKIVLANAGDVTIKVVEGKICVTGELGGTVTISSYTICGPTELVGSAWDPLDTNNDMTETTTGVWTLTKKNLTLEATDYEYKMVANHQYGVKDIPEGYNYKLTIATAGIYEVTFTFNATTDDLSAVAKAAPTAISNTKVENAAVKVIRNGQVLIVREGVTYNMMGQTIQ